MGTIFEAGAMVSLLGEVSFHGKIRSGEVLYFIHNEDGSWIADTRLPEGYYYLPTEALQDIQIAYSSALRAAGLLE